MNSSLVTHAASVALAEHGARLVRDWGSQDLYAAWQGIFERTRAVESGAEARSTPQEAAAQGRSDDINRSPSAERLTLRDTHAVAPRFQGGARVPTAMPSEAPLDVRGPRSIEQNPLLRVATPSGSVAGAQRSSRDATYSDVFTTRPLPDALSNHGTRQCAADPLPTSVVLFDEGETLAIFVRDTHLKEDQARRTALEAARILKGHSAALSHLTLNGRAIFQTPEEVRPEGSQRSGALLLFGC